MLIVTRFMRFAIMPIEIDRPRRILSAKAFRARLPPASIRFMTHPAPLPSFLGKLHARSALADKLQRLPRPLVFTNGVFDVLHRGHVMYLAQARELGASLLVALNTDASARRLGKGPDRPLNREEDRAIVVAALQSVDLVTWFDEDTPTELIRDIRPDILVKGGDYDMDRLPETSVVRAYGGRALALPFVDGYSTTRLVSRIRAGSAD
jgi:rfaE bifunctional protein nucleotidyltransferase chain/domain